MKVLVTGASGFFGNSLVPALVHAGHDVCTFGRSDKIAAYNNLAVEHRRGDISDPTSLEKAFAHIDAIIHMAGLVSYRKADYDRLYALNVVGTTNVMNAAVKANVGRVIHMSSIAGMGIPPKGVIGTEDLEYNLKGLNLVYCDTKHDGEVEALKFAQKGLPIIVLSPGITFGEGDTHPHHFTIFNSMAKGVLLGYPKGGVMFSDIKDVVSTTINSLTMGRPGERYVVGSANMTFKDAAYALSNIIGSKPPSFEIPGFISEFAGTACEAIFPLFGQVPKLTRGVAWLSQRDIFFSSDKAARELAHNQTPFEETLKRTASYYLTNRPGNHSTTEALLTGR